MSLEKDARPKPISWAGLATASMARVKDGGKINPAANTSQSQLLRALGVRVYRYTEEERRDIILKYLMKRTNRAGIKRPTKVPSRQALVGKHRRGIGGQFLSTDELQLEEILIVKLSFSVAFIHACFLIEKFVTSEQMSHTMSVPDLASNKSEQLIRVYAGTVGFSVRKGWWDKSARNVTRSRVYVRSREGYRPTNITNEAKKTQSETRTGCLACLAIKITPDGKDCVTEFVADHNHQLTAPLDIQMLRSQRLSAKFQTGGRQGARQIPASYKNYLRSKRVKNMQSGDADDFGRCMYDFEEEQEFLSVWEGMLVKYDLKDNEWLAKAAENAETYAFMEIQSDQLLEQVESILYAKLLEKPASKGQPQNLVQDGSNNGGSHGLSGKRKKNEHEAEVPVGIDGGPLSADVASNGRNPPQFFVPTQFIQGSFVSAHQFGLNGVQGFHGIAHFNQKSSATTLQQPFHNSSQLSQVLFASQFNGEELHLECSVEVLLGNALENGYNHGKEIQKD
ncbi:FAR1 DNA-binding domain [Musa troglodytarum]|uniref:Protein FAR1-RELATED SEQUENCE n=1 Tax=Musa troglodytarum TaxID=320322 RepID=A0A9E7I039_9LILI|nr:FAR1 DNA-binding domain [Musa troglodytarum]